MSSAEEYGTIIGRLAQAIPESSGDTEVGFTRNEWLSLDAKGKPLYCEHESTPQIGEIVDHWVDREDGMHIEARVFKNRPEVQPIWKQIESGKLGALSIGFQCDNPAAVGKIRYKRFREASVTADPFDRNARIYITRSKNDTNAFVLTLPVQVNSTPAAAAGTASQPAPAKTEAEAQTTAPASAKESQTTPVPTQAAVAEKTTTATLTTEEQKNAATSTTSTSGLTQAQHTAPEAPVSLPATSESLPAALAQPKQTTPPAMSDASAAPAPAAAAPAPAPAAPAAQSKSTPAPAAAAASASGDKGSVLSQLKAVTSALAEKKAASSAQATTTAAAPAASEPKAAAQKKAAAKAPAPKAVVAEDLEAEAEAPAADETAAVAADDSDDVNLDEIDEENADPKTLLKYMKKQQKLLRELTEKERVEKEAKAAAIAAQNEMEYGLFLQANNDVQFIDDQEPEAAKEQLKEIIFSPDKNPLKRTLARLLVEAGKNVQASKSQRGDSSTDAAAESHQHHADETAEEEEEAPAPPPKKQAPAAAARKKPQQPARTVTKPAAKPASPFSFAGVAPQSALLTVEHSRTRGTVQDMFGVDFKSLTEKTRVFDPAQFAQMKKRMENYVKKPHEDM